MIDYALVKYVHVASVVISGAGFLLRGAWMLSGSALLRHRLTRIAPHIVDTVLLASAVTLVFMAGWYPSAHAWVTAKIVALGIYILLGTMALKRARSRGTRALALVGAMMTFFYIVAVAVSRDPVPFAVF